ncbi:MAG: hypothetical protein IJU28_09125 [Clostridia bacterium]|nr:hypothetical protein [Clostridia bacterium]
MKYVYNGKEIFPSVEIYHDLIPYLAGISERDFYMDGEKCAEAWKNANGQISAFYGDAVPVRTPGAAPLSYGHLISIGAEYSLPQDSEPNIRPFARDIDEGIAILKAAKSIDFGACAMCRHYMEVNRLLRNRFPEANVSLLSGYSYEGIITSAVLMRGQDFFADLFDEPEKSHEFLELLNESIIAFCHWTKRMEGQEPVSSFGSYLCDDFAALIPPRLWDKFVIPYWDRYYSARATGSYRFLHCEGMSPPQLDYLAHAKITRYQPSVSEKLTIKDVTDHLDIPFDWLLYAWKLPDMSDEELQNWVDEAITGGAFKVRTQIGKYSWTLNKQERALAFIKAFEKYRVE